tara:strand:+ start:23435 stop:24610 length:1176 start_codon:yes stop_codon:yes gene_type:complete
MKLSRASDNLIGQKMFQILAKAQELEKKGKKIIHFEIGDPDFNTPLNIKNAAINSIKNNHTHYTNSMGILELRKAACKVTLKSRGFKPSIEQVLVTPGANFQIFLAISCIINPGDEVIIPDPSFVSYASIVNFLGGKIVNIKLKEENEFRLNPDDVAKKITTKTKVVIINSPHNPTGSVMNKKEIESIYKLVAKNRLYLISDEIYSRMIFNDSKTFFFSPSFIDHCKKHTILINGFSKSYAMTGWRLGVMTGPENLINKMGLLQETALSCVPKFTQLAGLEALLGSQRKIKEMVLEFKKRRDLLVSQLNNINGFSCLEPKGAFYVFPNIKKTKLTSEQISSILLHKCGIAVAPGNIFGANGEGYIRICYANSIKNITNGTSILKNYFGEKR